MPRKIMDISLIDDNNSDYTFFKIDEDEFEDNSTLRAMKQTYVTSNYKDETILNLKKELNTNSPEISKEIKLESYNKYNNALDLATRHYITKSIEFVEEALKLNPKDEDILNLRGLLALLKCDFSKAFESFYTAQCYENNELSRKYVGLLSSKDFKVFLERYNHSIRFINEQLNDESIEIFDSLMLEEPELIEPYEISILLYDRVGNEEKKNLLLEKLKEVDVDNPIAERFNDINQEITKEKVEEKPKEEKINQPVVNNTSNRSNMPLYIIIGLLVVGMFYFHISNKKQLEDLSNQISKNEEQKKDETQKEDGQTQVQDENNQLKEEDSDESEAEILKKDSEELYFIANDYKISKDYNNAIKYYKYCIEAAGTPKHKPDAIYNLGVLYKNQGKKDEAIDCFKRFVNTYSESEEFYDDAFYNLGILYYEEGKVQEAKDAFYTLKSQDPNSPYNSTEKVKNILSE